MSDDTPLLTVDDIHRYRRRVEEAAEALHTRIGPVPPIGIVLGTGLRAVADAIDVEATLSATDVPHLPSSRAETPDRQLVVGRLGGTRVVAMTGRLHLYEGHTPRQVTFPIRVLAAMGMGTMVITGAASGLDPHHEPGDLLLITDHINFQGVNPLVGPNVDDWGPRFPDMSEPYDPALRRTATDIALDAGRRMQKGVYLAVLGPNLETAAEYRMLRAMGADAVGMSTVPEVIVARHMDVRVLGLAVLTDIARPDALDPVSFDEIRAAADRAVPPLTTVVEGVVGTVGATDG
jgi:purine-nucleoside phosphorylase